MDSYKLYNSIHWLEYSSFTLNTEKSVILNNSLLVLKNENHFKKIFFWGIIQCLDSDYYISFGYQTDAIADRKFFYSNDCQNWKLLPDPKREHLVLAELCKRPFQGDPGLIIEVVDDAPPEETFLDENTSETYESKKESVEELQKSSDERLLDEATKTIRSIIDKEIPITREMSESELPQDTLKKREEEAEPPITNGELKEEDRLAAIIHILTEEVYIIPRGGLFKQTDGVTVHSQAFEGLKVDDADELCSFQHYRLPQQEWNTNLLTRVDYNYAMDFLDTIDKDIPSNIWVAQLIEGDRAIILHNLIWPGFTFFHHLETQDHGCFYLGTGQRNLDVPFMTQINEPIVSVELTEPSKKSIESSSKTRTLSKQGTEGQGSTETEDEVLLPVPYKKSIEEDAFKDEIITSA